MLLILAAVCVILIAVVGKMRGIRTAVIHSIVLIARVSAIFNLIFI